MPVVIVIAIVVVLAAVVFVASGRGGGMPAAEPADYAPLELGPVSATDIALLRPPTALWGYHQQATDEAMERIAESIRERDVRIVALEQLVTDLSRDQGGPMTLGAPYVGARHARPAEPADGPTVTAPLPVLPRRGAGGVFGPGAYGMELPGPDQRDATGEPPAHDSAPLSAPVAESAQSSPGGTTPRTPRGASDAEPRVPDTPGSGDVPPGESGTGWPPEVSHD